MDLLLAETDFFSAPACAADPGSAFLHAASVVAAIAAVAPPVAEAVTSEAVAVVVPPVADAVAPGAGAGYTPAGLAGRVADAGRSLLHPARTGVQSQYCTNANMGSFGIFHLHRLAETKNP